MFSSFFSSFPNFDHPSLVKALSEARNRRQAAAAAERETVRQPSKGDKTGRLGGAASDKAGVRVEEEEEGGVYYSDILRFLLAHLAGWEQASG